MTTEIWKVSCENSRNIYEVSNFGNVRKNGKDFECKLSSYVNTYGHKKEYKYFSSNHYVHREVHILFIGGIPEDFVVHHIDDNSMNNHADNLQCMSRSDHIRLHATGHDVSESTRKKISEAKTGEKNPRGMLNKHHSESSRKKISEANIGKKLMESTKKKMSEAHTGKNVSELTRKKLSESHSGDNCSKETRRKLSNAKSGEKNPKAKLIYKNVAKIREFLSESKLTQTEIAKIFNVDQSTISDIKHGRTWKKFPQSS